LQLLRRLRWRIHWSPKGKARLGNIAKSHLGEKKKKIQDPTKRYQQDWYLVRKNAFSLLSADWFAGTLVFLGL
jgi:hypothetical protein